jgi:hypothetical protein
VAPQAGFEPATLRLTGGKNEISRALPPFAGLCRTLRQPAKNLTVFRFRPMPGFAALCRSLLPPKGKKRATSQPKPKVVIGRSEAPKATFSQTQACSCFVFVVDRVSFWQHAFVQDAGNENASWLTSEKHDVLALLDAAQAEANVVAGAARRRVVGQPLATGFKLVNVADGLRRTPSAQRVLTDA